MELATAKAAKIVVSNLLPKLNCKTAPNKELNGSIIPIFLDSAVPCGYSARRSTDRLRRLILRCLRNSKISDNDYNRISRLWKRAYLLLAPSQSNGEIGDL